MKPYTVEIDIDLPRERVLELFEDPDNLVKWQKGLQRYERLSGGPGQPGSTARLVFQQGKREFDLMETLTERKRAADNGGVEELNGTYEWAGGSNTLRNEFHELGPDRTRYRSTCGYRLQSLPLRIMGFLMPGAFRKQHAVYLQAFKDFAENGADVRDAT